MEKKKTSMKNEKIIDRFIIVLIIIAVILGIGLGFAFRSINLSEKDKVYFGFPGELWIRSLKFISIPLIFFNLITGISDLYIEKDVKLIVLHMLLFYSCSILISLAIGYLLVLTIKPGINYTVKF
jgi:Na+/H+-dicarboxylate symporter